jgi:hypothetical protein
LHFVFIAVSPFFLYTPRRLIYSFFAMVDFQNMFRARAARWGAAGWLGVNAAVPAVGLWTSGVAGAGWPPPASLFSAYAAAVLFYLLFLWPLWIPSALRAEAAGGAGARPGLTLAGHLVFFAALGAPFGLLCARLADAGPGAAWRSVAVLAAAAACVAAAFARGADRPRRDVLYQAAAWTLCAAAPLLYYLGREWGGSDWRWLAAVSPFRGAADPGAATAWGPLWIVQAGGYGLLAIALAAGAWLGSGRKKAGD